MRGVQLRVKRVKTLFEHGQITNVTAMQLLQQRIPTPAVAEYVFLHTVLGHGERN